MKYERLYELREKHDLKQITVAEELHIKQGTYSNYESGIINVPIEAFIRLAKLYNTSIDYIVGLTDDPSPYNRKEK